MIEWSQRLIFITLLGGAAAWPLPARAQQSAVPVIGFLSTASQDPFANFVAAFLQGLNEAGLVEGKDVMIEYRWAHDQFDRLPALAAQLVQLRVAVIVAGANASAAAGKRQQPRRYRSSSRAGAIRSNSGLSRSLRRPGGNATGFALFMNDLEVKRLELLRTVLNAALIALFVNPNNPRAETNIKVMQAAARVVGTGNIYCQGRP